MGDTSVLSVDAISLILMAVFLFADLAHICVNCQEPPLA